MAPLDFLAFEFSHCSYNIHKVLGEDNVGKLAATHNGYFVAQGVPFLFRVNSTICHFKKTKYFKFLFELNFYLFELVEINLN